MLTQKAFHKIGLIARLDSDNARSSMQSLSDLLEHLNKDIFIDHDSAPALPASKHEIVDRKTLVSRSDLIIVVGGDGSLLSAARSAAGSQAKVLGINRGRLGFLTDISPEDIEHKVSQILVGEYISEKRFLLNANIVRDGHNTASGSALNDVVIHSEDRVQMIEFELYINNEFVYRQRSDGLIISTPTGSTAYALSCGGPIMHPSLDAVELVPMNPHRLSSRPIIVHGDSLIRVVLCHENTKAPHLTADGQLQRKTQTGDEIHIQKMSQAFELIHPIGHNFYETCRTKLGWHR